ncbi:fimbria/pilus outer membrane usher protein [Serratia sp. UGAL515B_01]|uniref:fimbria/pilus outer membrane usher protein n=1 Tax=Serratia sp. UGAL515B_01 TaxID=2986763 RepID=UPI002952DFB8|nr:fimbria/pilus outer membrane usher protein [Serratia sp. UGAL515B_01]WON77764.1 fimbrial biogenesis outer membrane usher protein [Serratia sp. UGAL515B_01]
MNQRQIPTPSLRVSQLARLITLLLGCSSFMGEAKEYFDPALLAIGEPEQGNSDLSAFEAGNNLAAGTYRVGISLNDRPQDARDIEFRLVKGAEGKESLQPCLTLEQLQAMGVKTELFPNLGDADTKCVKLDAIAQANTHFDFARQQLMLSIPQAAIVQTARDFIPESQWDNGIPALLLNYQLSGANNVTRSRGNMSNQFANLRPGLNVGSWRLRNYTTWSKNSNAPGEWNTLYTYAQRNLIGLKSKLTLGDSNSPSDVFDGVSFRGAQLSSDDDMIPNSLKGYAPVIRGIARTNAQISIRQNGNLIYQSFVSPGAFEINDLYPTGGGGDLHVTIKESDGNEQHIVVPFASLPILRREGQFKYALTGGQYRSYNGSVDKTPFGQGVAIYGLPQGTTVYGGGQFAHPYQSLALGIGKNLGNFGGLSLDITQSWASLKDQSKESGQSLRLRYSKSIAQTGTSLAIAGYRYSTDGYYNLQDVLNTYREGENLYVRERRRSRSELTLNQKLWEKAGNLSLSWISEDYWNSERTTRSLGIQYNNYWQGISYELSYSNNQSSSTSGRNGQVYARDQIFAFNISVPLDRWLKNSYASYYLNSSRDIGSNNRLSFRGTALEDKNLNWMVQQGYGSRDMGNSGNLNLDYRGRYAETVAGYAYSPNNQRLNYALSGGVIAHSEGVTFGQPLGETVVLVKAPGASGVGVTNKRGVKTDWRGYAIIPYSSPYKKNNIQLNAETLPDNTELALTAQEIVPTRGAVAKVSFDTKIGQRMLMTLIRKGGQAVPFGAIVTELTQQDTQGFIVGDEGQVYLVGLADNGVLKAKWGNDADQQCQVKYTLAKQATDNSGVSVLEATCL